MSIKEEMYWDDAGNLRIVRYAIGADSIKRATGLRVRPGSPLPNIVEIRSRMDRAIQQSMVKHGIPETC